MKRSGILLFFSIVAAGWTLSAQSNDFLDDLLAREEASFGQAAVLTLASAGLVGEEATVEEALAALRQRGWAAPADPQAPIRLGEYAWLLMRVYGIKGGIGYSLFPGPRYAARELAWRQMIQGKARPGMTVSGERVVRILGRVIELQGAR